MLTEDSPLHIEAWDPRHHDRTGFDCGVKRLNNYLALSAKKQFRDDMVRVYVAVEPNRPKILGYHAINVGRMSGTDLIKPPRGLPNHSDIPVLFLGQIAVDRGAQGLGVGSVLMHHVFEKACVVADHAGCHAILLDILSDGDAEALFRRKNRYEAFGFQSFPSNPSRLFMTMKQVRRIVEETG